MMATAERCADVEGRGSNSNSYGSDIPTGDSLSDRSVIGKRDYRRKKQFESERCVGVLQQHLTLVEVHRVGVVTKLQARTVPVERSLLIGWLTRWSVHVSPTTI